MARRFLCVAGVVVLCFSFAWSWGGATHQFINMQAMKHLPPSFPFFANNAQWISIHAVDADNRKSNDPTEAPKHFIDIEDYPEFATHTLSHNYDTLVAKHGLPFVTNAGVVPWAIIWSFDSLTNCLRRGDSLRALQFAADLGHYVGDAHQPLHVTANYDGGETGNNGIHSRYESTMLANYSYLSQVTVIAKQAHFIPVPIDTNFVFVNHGNSLVDSILKGDNYAKAIDPTYKSSYYAALWEKTGPLTQNQIQDATVDLANLWFTAAVNAGLVTDSSALASLTASPTEVAFGKVTLGSFKDTTVTITNKGTNALNISSIVSSGNPFSIRTTSASLAPGQSLIDTLRFTPSSIGPVHASILIVSNSDTSPDTVMVDGSGQPLAGVEISQTGVPDQFGLSQNYPNPFNPSTMIRYALPNRSIVQIKVFNVLGQLITELVSGEQAAGYREVMWNASVPSGIYFYRIEAVSVDNPALRFTAVRKMLLLK
jgi:Abnormal spindle-like microcephaly-assoc'd, ASPM-SPD-2-Hydin/S1/P1 Nuclease/Secretion system C-terminal sorting domain